jgi:hypothetical protein
MTLAIKQQAEKLLESSLTHPEIVTENEFQKILRSDPSNLSRLWAGQNILHRLAASIAPVSWIKIVLSSFQVHSQVKYQVDFYIPLPPLVEIVCSYLDDNKEGLVSQKDSFGYTPGGRAKQLAALISAQRNLYLEKAKLLEPDADSF